MNSLFAITPYKFEGLWVFDDSDAGLAKEPFISGADRILDVMTQNIPDADKGFRLIFSSGPFPGYTARFVWSRSEYGGNWYFWPEKELEGWLCPALFRAGAHSGFVLCRQYSLKVHADGSNPAGGQAQQAMGRTKGGLNTKIHAVVNARSQAIVIALSSGNEADISLAGELTECLPEDSTLIGDTAYDSSTLRQTAAAKGVKTCIPGRTNRTTTVPFSAKIYRRRHRVENFFQRIKRYRQSLLAMTNSPKLSWASSALPSCSPFASHR